MHISMHTSDPSATYVESAAQLIMLPIDASLLAGVISDFQRIEGMALFLMEFPLDRSVEAAPVFHP